MEEEIYVAFDRYLSNDMSTKERFALEQQLQGNEDLSEKMRIYRQALETLSLRYKHEEMEDRLRQNLEVIGHEALKKKQARVLQLNWPMWAAAASITFLCGILLSTFFSKPTYRDYAHYEPLALVERGEVDTLKVKAQQGFNRQHYADAVTSLSRLLESDPDNEALKLYKGIALLELGRTQEANALFEYICQTSSAYKDRATWMLALSALKEKDYAHCANYLKEIPESSSEYRQAQKLLNDL